MTPITPPAIAAYLVNLSAAPHAVLTRILDEGRANNVPVVDPLSGALLHALVRAMGATRVLEIGTAIGYSTLWMAAALPPTGLLVTLERDHQRATTARCIRWSASVRIERGQPKLSRTNFPAGEPYWAPSARPTPCSSKK